MQYEVILSRAATKDLSGLPTHILTRFRAWVLVAEQGGVQALAKARSYRDKKLSGDMAHLRSSRLNRQYRVVYSVSEEEDGETKITIEVIEVSAHRYRRR